MAGQPVHSPREAIEKNVENKGIIMSKFQLKILKPGNCPFCEKNIYVRDKNNRPVKENSNHTYVWVRLNDGSNTYHSVCKDCLKVMDWDKIHQITLWQRYSWGNEICANPLGIFELGSQLKWYIGHAVHLTAVQWDRTENGLQDKCSGPDKA